MISLTLLRLTKSIGTSGTTDSLYFSKMGEVDELAIVGAAAVINRASIIFLSMYSPYLET